MESAQNIFCEKRANSQEFRDHCSRQMLSKVFKYEKAPFSLKKNL